MDDLFRDRQAQDLAEQMQEMGMSEEDYVKLRNLAIRLKTDSANNNQGDQDQGLQEREGEEGLSGLEEKEDSPPTQNSRAAASAPPTPRSPFVAVRSYQSARTLNFSTI